MNKWFLSVMAVLTLAAIIGFQDFSLIQTAGELPPEH